MGQKQVGNEDFKLRAALLYRGSSPPIFA